jgi:hypothetical protein
MSSAAGVFFFGFLVALVLWVICLPAGIVMGSRRKCGAGIGLLLAAALSWIGLLILHFMPRVPKSETVLVPAVFLAG